MSESERRPRRQASISTRRGDAGETGLGGGGRVSKADERVEAYGAIDEVNAMIGLGRALCEDAEVRAELRAIQRELFAVGSAVSTKPEANKPIPEVSKAMVERLDALVEPSRVKFRSKKSPTSGSLWLSMECDHV